MPKNKLLQFTSKGIYCPQADVYIDPWHKVKKALITHGHADHARWGNEHYLATHLTLPIIQKRLNLKDSQLQGVGYGELIQINGVEFSFHPAGHVVGSAQIKISYKGESWVVSGDYKTEDDGISTPFEAVKCQYFITESTFGLPIYQWEDQAHTFAQINAWWKQNATEGKTSILTAYSLGKAQRIIHHLDHEIGKIFTHGAVEEMNEVIRASGVSLKATERITKDTPKNSFKGAMVICPASALGTSWVKKLQPYVVGSASGWMSLRGARRRRNIDKGFVMSDHADWNGLNQAVAATQAEKVYVTHGYSSIYSQWLNEQGIESEVVTTEYGNEEE